jgi:dihydrofolate synthase/folylpolyglutamate synthase
MNPLEFLFGLEFHGHKFGLENIRILTDALGRPQDAWRSVSIAGTNGKGSVSAMAACALTAAGYRTGCYTSPHLVHLQERYAIDGEAVTAVELEQVVGELRALIDRLRAEGRLHAAPTFFEVATAAAFELFRRRRVDVAVLEVGLGGRLDATTVATPAAGAITNIDFDHQQHLGYTLSEIAFEKAGIIKPGMLLVCGEWKPEALEVIAAVCRERQATLIPARDGVSVSTACVAGQATVELRTPEHVYGPVTLSLRGRHQVDNAVVAVRLLEAIGRTGTPVPASAIERGLRHARWPGRLDLVRMADGRTVLLDAAHNPAGAASLAAYLGEVAPAGLPIVFGAVRDKDHAGMLGCLLPHATHLVVTSPPTPRAADLDELRRLAARVRPELRVLAEPDPSRALGLAWTLGPDVCVAGSIFLIGAILPSLPAVPRH